MRTVLVVEDSLTQREIMSELLKSSGLNVSAACDGVEALDKIQRNCPDLIVLDIILPRMNGYELCRRIKSDPKTQHVVVVMCSGKKEEFDRYWGIKQGADAYICKPFKPHELIDTVQHFLKSVVGNV
ncbi:MAG: response regulator [Kastovskya adunca ATA6-11-RM4]|jgi:twitching motility two-component system response regulator PilH|nr:response regulator [Kastovskya adunca ATA6-11-RM4]